MKLPKNSFRKKKFAKRKQKVFVVKIKKIKKKLRGYICVKYRKSRVDQKKGKT